MRGAVPGVLAALLCSPAFAAVTVTLSDGSPASSEIADVIHDPATGRWTVELLELYDPGGLNTFRIRGTGTEVIELVNVAVPCWASGETCIPAGSPVEIWVTDVATVIEIAQTEENVDLTLVRVEASQDIGRVECHNIGALVAGRDVLGPVLATHESDPGKGIGLVRAARHVRGDVLAPQGRITNVYSVDPSDCCWTGNVGLPGAPIAITARHGISQVAGVEIHAHVTTNADGGDGTINTVLAERFTGSVRTRRFVPSAFNPSNAGHLYVPVSFRGDVVIDESFVAPRQMTLPAGGIDGQIVINAANVGGVWAAPIRFGVDGDPNQVVLNGPGDAVDPALLGGSAIAVAPFALHDEACTPPNGGTASRNAGDPPITIRLRHDGPVVVEGGPPIVVQRRPAGAAVPFQTVTGFTATSDPKDANAVLVAATPAAAGFEPDHEYRLVATAALRSAGVSGTPAVQWEQPYLVTIGAACDADLNDDDLVDIQDVLAVLATWGTSGAGDVTGDGVVGIGDLLYVLGRVGPC